MFFELKKAVNRGWRQSPITAEWIQCEELDPVADTSWEKVMRTLSVVSLLVPPLLLSSCNERRITGLIDPDPSCDFALEGDLRHDGILDVGPTESLTHSYEAVLLIEGHPGDEITEATVAFADADGVPLPDTHYNGQDVVFPSVEGERSSPVQGTLDDEGRAAVAFTLVTEEEAAPLQIFTSGQDFPIRVEVRAVVDGLHTIDPYWIELTLCQGCLVGVDAEVQGDTLVCDDGSAPTPVDPVPCREGQDDVYSACTLP
jgi:hypothetical protein